MYAQISIYGYAMAFEMIESLIHDRLKGKFRNCLLQNNFPGEETDLERLTHLVKVMIAYQ